jgi:hypothetical protein
MLVVMQMEMLQKGTSLKCTAIALEAIREPAYSMSLQAAMWIRENAEDRRTQPGHSGVLQWDNNEQLPSSSESPMHRHCPYCHSDGYVD